MKFLDKLNLSLESRIYVIGTIFISIAMFIVMAVLFLVIIANNLNIIMSQPAGETYAYIIFVMYRIFAFVIIFGIIPFSIYQFSTKNKSKTDKTISIIASFVLTVVLFIFIGGEFYCFNKYSSGGLSYSKLFCKPTLETKLFDKYLIKTGAPIPELCQERK